MENPKRPISPEGMEKLKLEWEELWYRTRPKLLEEIAAAAAQGDRSENAEYIYGKKKLREIDKRLRQLDDKIGKSVVIEGGRASDTIAFGARTMTRTRFKFPDSSTTSTARVYAPVANGFPSASTRTAGSDTTNPASRARSDSMYPRAMSSDAVRIAASPCTVVVTASVRASPRIPTTSITSATITESRVNPARLRVLIASSHSDRAIP